jgi:hypothetical protein
MTPVAFWLIVWKAPPGGLAAHLKHDAWCAAPSMWLFSQHQQPRGRGRLAYVCIQWALVGS